MTATAPKRKRPKPTSTSCYRQDSKWYWKNPRNGDRHGPFEKRSDARQFARELSVQAMDERPPSKLPMEAVH